MWVVDLWIEGVADVQAGFGYLDWSFFLNSKKQLFAVVAENEPGAQEESGR